MPDPAPRTETLLCHAMLYVMIISSTLEAQECTGQHTLTVDAPSEQANAQITMQRGLITQLTDKTSYLQAQLVEETEIVGAEYVPFWL